MKTARIVQWVLLGLIVFGLGAGVAIWQRHKMAQNAPVESAQGAASEVMKKEDGATSALPDIAATAAVESGTIVPEAPAMPEIKAEAPSSETVVSKPAVDAAEGAEKTEPQAGDTAAPVASGTIASGPGGPFALVDQKGKAVTEKSWPGKYKLIFFGFTSCPDICPAALQKMSAALEQLGGKAGAVQPILITTDPSTDTPEVMNTYLGGYEGFTGLTGSKEQVDAAIKAYKVYSSGPDHSAFVYLMSPEDKALEIISSKIPAEEMAAKIAPHLPEAAAK